LVLVGRSDVVPVGRRRRKERERERESGRERRNGEIELRPFYVVENS
jgi:hypothetical protein